MRVESHDLGGGSQEGTAVWVCFCIRRVLKTGGYGGPGPLCKRYTISSRLSLHASVSLFPSLPPLGGFHGARPVHLHHIGDEVDLDHLVVNK